MGTSEKSLYPVPDSRRSALTDRTYKKLDCVAAM